MGFDDCLMFVKEKVSFRVLKRRVVIVTFILVLNIISMVSLSRIHRS